MKHTVDLNCYSMTSFREARFNSPEIQAIVEMLRELAPFGARRRNFENMYSKDEYTLKKLANDPRDIPYGYWH